MPHFIRVEQQEDLDFLKQLTSDFVMKMKTATSSEDIARYVDMAPIVYRLHDAVASAVKGKDADRIELPKEAFPEDFKKKKDSAKDTAYNYNLCPEHPKYGAARVPGKDCDGCWAAYKRMHPEKYDTARRKFDIKQRQNGD